MENNRIFSRIINNSIFIFYLVIVVFIFSDMIMAQITPSTNQNYTLSTTIKVPVLSIDQIPSLNEYSKSQIVKYYNSMGKLNQILNYKYFKHPQPDNKFSDLVTHISYDNLGLETMSYLPYSKETGNGIFINDAGLEQNNYYTTPKPGIATDDSPFSVKVYEKSPLLRLLEQGSVGSSYQPGTNHNVQFIIETNTEDEVLVITPSGDNMIVSGYYNPGTLNKTKIIDENGIISYEYKDFDNKMILKKTLLSTGIEVKTYNVYDNAGNLRFIISPEGCALLPTSGEIDSTNVIRNLWTTEFRYDGFNREIEKISPEEDKIYTIYDRAGRVILRQDGLMRENQEWLFTKYDNRGRVILTGIYYDTRDRTQLQPYVNSLSNGLYEQHSSTEWPYYTNNVFPVLSSIDKIWIMNYYGTYDIDQNGTDDVHFNGSAFPVGDHVDHEDPLYPSLMISGFSHFDRISDKLTVSKKLVLGVQGKEVQFAGDDKIYKTNPPSPEKVYYKGNNIILKPGFRTYPRQNVNIGPNIEVPANTPQANETYLQTTYFYDKYGRAIQTKAENHLGGTDIISSQYDFSGKKIRQIFDHHTYYQQLKITERYTYDHADRLIDTYHQINSANEVIVSRNEYNELSQLVSKKLGCSQDGISYLQKLDYHYNIRGWLKGINDPYNLCEGNPDDSHPGDIYPDDLFAFSLYYDDPGPSNLSNIQRYDGNISAMIISNSISGDYCYKYTYDNLCRLTEAQGIENPANWILTNRFYEGGIDYDLNGNIRTLIRKSEENGTVIDNLSYTHIGNKLKAVNDLVPETGLSYDFKNGENLNNEYSYDNNGNLIEDLNKGVTIINNYLNLPECVTWNDGRRIDWLYDANGNKLKKTVSFPGSNSDYVQDFVSGFTYKDDLINEPVLSFFPMPEGRVVNSGNYEYQYWLKDHLGNVRLSFIGNSTRQPLEGNFYYPFGTTVNLFATGDENKFKYNGKELEDDHNLNWYHYGARFYDPQIGRWNSMDPADEFHSPYAYVGNNPGNIIDPDGRQAIKPMSYFQTTKADYNAAVSSFNKYGLEVGDFTFRMLFEPYDYFRTGVDWANGDFSYWDLAGLLPAVPGGLRKAYEKSTAVVQYTKSNLSLGQKMHRAYMADIVNKELGLIKEFKLPSGKRIDFLDINSYKIYELKPNNPRAIRAGWKQLSIYENELMSMPEYDGIRWIKQLDSY